MMTRSTPVSPLRRRRAMAALLVVVVAVAAVWWALHSRDEGTPGAAEHPIGRSGGPFGTPHYFSGVTDDTFYNTVGTDGTILSTANDSTGVNDSCTARGKDIVIMDDARTRSGASRDLDRQLHGQLRTQGRRQEPRRMFLEERWHHEGRDARSTSRSHASCTGARTASRPTACSHRSTRASSSRSTAVAPGPIRGASPALTARRRGGTTGSVATVRCFPGEPVLGTVLHPVRARQHPDAVDGAGKYLYAVSTDGYAYNGNYLHLARVPLGKVQQARAWQYYHGVVGGSRP